MRAYRLGSPEGIQSLKLVTMPDPNPGPGQVAIAVRACSFNYRDSLLIRGGYPRNRTYPVIPLSDGAGEVGAIGAGVTRFQVGDRVAANFTGLASVASGDLCRPTRYNDAIARIKEAGSSSLHVLAD